MGAERALTIKRCSFRRPHHRNMYHMHRWHVDYVSIVLSMQSVQCRHTRVARVSHDLLHDVRTCTYVHHVPARNIAFRAYLVFNWCISTAFAPCLPREARLEEFSIDSVLQARDVDCSLKRQLRRVL